MKMRKATKKYLWSLFETAMFFNAEKADIVNDRFDFVSDRAFRKAFSFCINAHKAAQDAFKEKLFPKYHDLI